MGFAGVEDIAVAQPGRYLSSLPSCGMTHRLARGEPAESFLRLSIKFSVASALGSIRVVVRPNRREFSSVVRDAGAVALPLGARTSLERL